MAKFDIDSILSELGVNGAQADGGAAGRTRPSRSGDPAGLEEPRRRHNVDQAERSFTPLPAVPSGQRSFTENISVEEDPAVPVPPRTTPVSNVGAALSDVYQPDESETGQGDAGAADLAQSLIECGAATARQITQAQDLLKQAGSGGRRLADLAVEQGADEVAVQQTVARLAGVPFLRIEAGKSGGGDAGFDERLLTRLTPEFCKRHMVLPLRVEGGRVVVGATHPDQVFLWDEVRRRLGANSLKIVVVTATDIRTAMELSGQGGAQDVDYSALLANIEEGDVEVEKVQDKDEVNLEQVGNESPVIIYVNHIIQKAAQDGASDIHVEPSEKKLKIRFRVDGLLYDAMTPPPSMAAAITSRIKIMANLDISERRLPQDGRIRCKVQGRNLDLRVSTLPNSYGEKTVMRILDTKSINVEMEQLGFSDDALTIWKRQINEPHGIVLVTGPTGSGKTTTLYASLRALDKSEMNVSTVEDPVEYHLDGITQTQMHEKIGMTFARALKALLRQDPDVIMLGEIRDQETAVTAVQAALTGHLVLSTLHTNDAPSSITRLVNIGLEPFLVGAAVRAVLAQRLVRKLCQHCKRPATPTEEMLEYLTMQGVSLSNLWQEKGCERCRNRGFSGRVGIYELLTVDDQLRDIIARNPNVSEFRRTCIERGMVTLRQDGMAKVGGGLTTVEEVFRVTESGA